MKWRGKFLKIIILEWSLFDHLVFLYYHEILNLEFYYLIINIVVTANSYWVYAMIVPTYCYMDNLIIFSLPTNEVDIIIPLNLNVRKLRNEEIK